MPMTLVQPGDRFLRKGNPPSSWKIERLMEFPDMPLHVRLFREDRPSQTIVIAASVLDDPKEFNRLFDEQDDFG